MSKIDLCKILDELEISSQLQITIELDWGLSFSQILKNIAQKPIYLENEKYENSNKILLKYILKVADQDTGIIFKISTDKKIGLYELQILGTNNEFSIKDTISSKLLRILPDASIEKNIISDENIDIIIFENAAGRFEFDIIQDKTNRYDHGNIVLEEIDGNPLYSGNSIILEPMEYRLLEKIRELILKQQEAINAFAITTGVLAWDYWMSGIGKWNPLSKYRNGTTKDGNWHWSFHGYECAFNHIESGSNLRIDFGENHRTDTFTDWGLSCFKPMLPWKIFEDLDEWLLQEPFDPFIYDSSLRLYELVRKLRNKKMIMYSSTRRIYNISPLGWIKLNNDELL